MTHLTTSFAEPDGVRTMADKVVVVGRFVGLLGVVLVLLLIGGLKFTQVEIDGLKPIIEPTPWLAWMYPVFGEAGSPRRGRTCHGPSTDAVALVRASRPRRFTENTQ